MVDHRDVQRLQGVSEPVGEQPVGCAGLGGAGGVIVRDDHRGGIECERSAGHLPGIDGCLADGAIEQQFGGDQAVLGIQEKSCEMFARLVSKPQAEELPHLRRRTQGCAFAQVLAHRAKNELLSRLQARAPQGG